MRKLLLLISMITFVGLSSCSKDEVVEISQEEKELLVKQTLIEFNNSAIKTGKLQKFVKSFSKESSTKTLSDAEVEALFQKFLGNQTQTFLDLYYQLEAMNMSREEFLSIANQFEYLKLEIRNNLGKSSSGVKCDGDSLHSALLEWLNLCEEKDEDQDQRGTN